MKPARDGRLILVLGADAALLDVAIRAVACRLSGLPQVSFVEPLTTHPLPAGSGEVVPASRLVALERSGALALTWRDGPALRGLHNSVLGQLACGTSVVAGASADIAADARALWPQTRVVRLGGRIDPLRAPLGPRASFDRTAGGLRHTPLGRLRETGIDARVDATGHLGDTVGRLSEVIARLLPASAANVSIARGRRRRARSGDVLAALGDGASNATA